MLFNFAIQQSECRYLGSDCSSTGRLSIQTRQSPGKPKVQINSVKDLGFRFGVVVGFTIKDPHPSEAILSRSLQASQDRR